MMWQMRNSIGGSAPASACDRTSAAPFPARNRLLRCEAASTSQPGRFIGSSQTPSSTSHAQSKLVLPPSMQHTGRSSDACIASASAVEAPVMAPKASSQAPMIIVNGQRVHSTSPRCMEVIQGLGGWAEETLPRYLKDSSICWQPSDFLPNPADPYFLDHVHELRTQAAVLPLDYMVVLVGDMVTEEALPSYMNMLNTLDGCKDESGASSSPWAKWNRHWTSEENRHGDLLNKYLYLCGRVDMAQVERTIQNLIGSGLDPKLENNPYLCFVYTSFQERATKISHGNTARLASYNGNAALAKLCGIIAADEARHEAGYTAIVSQLFEHDPDGAMLAYADMMKKGIVMPAHFMDDGWHNENNSKGSNLFMDYATVADTLGVYTTMDYADIVDHLTKKWDVANARVESGEAAEAQEFLVKHAGRVRRLAELQMERRLRDRKRGKTKIASFSWVHKKEMSLV